MSHYSTTNKLVIKGLEELTAALVHMGYTVEDHAELRTLYDWHGHARPEKAQVIIRRQYTGLPSSNDVGFFQAVDGTIRAVISDYDSSKFSDKWLAALTKECGVQRAMMRAKRMGHRVTRTVDAKGRPRLEVVGRW